MCLSDLSGLRRYYKDDGKFLIFSKAYPNCNDIVSANFNANAKTLILFLIHQYFIAKIFFTLQRTANSTCSIFILHQFFTDVVKISIDIACKVVKLHILHWSKILKETIMIKESVEYFYQLSLLSIIDYSTALVRKKGLYNLHLLFLKRSKTFKHKMAAFLIQVASVSIMSMHLNHFLLQYLW